MMKKHNRTSLSSIDIQEDLKRCAYSIFFSKGLSDKGKPNFLLTGQKSFTGFPEYFESSLDNAYSELLETQDILERTCLVYSLFKYIGSMVYSNNNITGMFLHGYLYLFTLVEKPANKDGFIYDCIKLMLPTALPILSQGDQALDNLEMFLGLGTSKEMLDNFYSEYDLPIAQSLEESLLRLLDGLYFLGILLQQDCELLEEKHIEKLIIFIKSQVLWQGLEANVSVQNEDILRVVNCLKALLKIYKIRKFSLPDQTKTLLFSLVLNVITIMLPKLNDVSEESLYTCGYTLKEYILGEDKIDQDLLVDTFVILFALGFLDKDILATYMKAFSVDSLIQIVKRMEIRNFLGFSIVNSLMYLDLILNYSCLVVKSFDEEQKQRFFAETKDVFSKALITSMDFAAKLFYDKPELCNQEMLSMSNQDLEVTRSMTNFDSRIFFLVIRSFQIYRSAFPEAIELLSKFYSSHFSAINDAKGWGNSTSLSLFQRVGSALVPLGIKRSDLDFIIARDSCEALILKSSDMAGLALDKNDFLFWEKWFEIFNSVHQSIKEWSEPQRCLIDSLCIDVVEKMSFIVGSQSSLLETKLFVIISNLISKEANIKFCSHIPEVLNIINLKCLDYSMEQMYQLMLIKKWLLHYVEEGDTDVNSRVLEQVKLLDRHSSSEIHHLVYLSRLAEILYNIMQKSFYFKEKADLYNKVSEIGSFICKERNKLYKDISAISDINCNVKLQSLLQKGQLFLDAELIDLLRTKLPQIEFEENKSVHSKHYKVFSITNISFIEEKIIIHAENDKFSLEADRMPALNILNAKVYYYKNQDRVSLYPGDKSSKLIELERYQPNIVAEALTDDALVELLENDNKKVASKSKKKKSKKKPPAGSLKNNQAASAETKESVSTEVLFEETAIEKNNSSDYDDHKKDLKAAEVNQDISPCKQKSSTNSQQQINWDDKLEILLKNLEQSDDPGVILNEIALMVKDRLGFMVNIEENNIFSLGPCKLFIGNIGPSEFWQECAALPEKLFALEGLDSFASVVYDTSGKINMLAIADPLKEFFSLSPKSIKGGNLLKSAYRLRQVFFESIEEKLKVETSLQGSIVSLILHASDMIVSDSFDLNNISPGQLWSELIKSHNRLLCQIYGGNIALVKIDFGKVNSAMVIESAILPERVEIRENNIIFALDEFFKPLDRATFEIFKSLNVKMVEFITKVMRYASTDIFIYGHPVIEHSYSKLLRSCGANQITPSRLIIRLNAVLDISAIRAMLDSSDIKATVKGIKPYAVYCYYQGCNITICLDHSYMKSSIFSGDHFCGMFEKDTLTYRYNEDNPKYLKIVASNDTSGEIFKTNPYALKDALSWSKILGRAGGGLKEILASLGFLNVVNEFGIRDNIWYEPADSEELLSKAKSCLKAVFHLSSDQDAEDILSEVKGMSK